MKLKRSEIIIVVLLLMLSISFVIYTRASAKNGRTAQLTYTYKYKDVSGREEKRSVEIPLNKDKSYDFESMEYVIHINVKNGAAAFVNSPCPDHKCEHYGYLSKSGENAICLPAKAVLVVK